MTAADELLAFLRAQLDVRERHLNRCEMLAEPSPISYKVLLAEVAAKRAILDAYELAWRVEWGDDPAQAHGEQIMGDRVIEQLVQPYAGYEGFQEAWRT